MRPRDVTTPDKSHFTRFDRFAAEVCGVPLRAYQREAGAAILDSALRRRGLSFAVLMSRQAGKNELSALIEAYLLILRGVKGGQIVKASPTYRPQTLNSRLRLQERFPYPSHLRRREGHILEFGKARCIFLSAAPSANVVGATASLLLECDEAQAVDPAKWQRDFAPMAASTHATTVFWGTAWTDRTLLARVARQLREQEAADGVRRVFVYDADVVAAEVPAYARHVADQVARLGREHPLVRSQYYLEEIQGEGGLFPAVRQAQLRGTHPRQAAPTPGRAYALLIDVGGAAAEATPGRGEDRERNARRDATALTVVEIDATAAPDLTLGLPLYRIIDRRLWLGVGHASLYGQLVDLAHHWQAAHIVVDATGVGAGLAQFLARALGPRVVPITLNAATKSSLGWRLQALIDTGRLKDYADDGAPDTRQFWYEVAACEFEASDHDRLRWGVWETPRYDGLVARGHADLPLSAALCAVLDDRRGWGHAVSAVVEAGDALADADRGGY